MSEISELSPILGKRACWVWLGSYNRPRRGYASFELGGADSGHTVDTWWTHEGHTMDTTMDTRWTLWKHDILCAAREQIMAELNKCLRWHTFPCVFAVSIECPSLCPLCVRRGSIVVSAIAWSQVGHQTYCAVLMAEPLRGERNGSRILQPAPKLNCSFFHRYPLATLHSMLRAVRGGFLYHIGTSTLNVGCPGGCPKSAVQFRRGWRRKVYVCDECQAARAIDGVRHLIVNCTMNAQRVRTLPAVRHLMVNCSM